ncbi:hypothetical protein PAQU9191_03381 [Photobacterium aquimaris]|uniref:Uncharacterized protein n=1 Tax=Photobacterium aquimaris TaxID=512643 RepID=A0A1Y6L694_9GAMM|nr:hypothetical protein PAQU9191_03381 [Photobacterium aquimaris]
MGSFQLLPLLGVTPFKICFLDINKGIEGIMRSQIKLSQ